MPGGQLHACPPPPPPLDLVQHDQQVLNKDGKTVLFRIKFFQRLSRSRIKHQLANYFINDVVANRLRWKLYDIHLNEKSSLSCICSLRNSMDRISILFQTNDIMKISWLLQASGSPFKCCYTPLHMICLKCRCYNWVFHDRLFCQVIWQIFTQGRAKKIPKKLPPVGIETRTSRSSGQCLANWAR